MVLYCSSTFSHSATICFWIGRGGLGIKKSLNLFVSNCGYCEPFLYKVCATFQATNKYNQTKHLLYFP